MILRTKASKNVRERPWTFDLVFSVNNAESCGIFTDLVIKHGEKLSDFALSPGQTGILFLQYRIYMKLLSKQTLFRRDLPQLASLSMHGKTTWIYLEGWHLLKISKNNSKKERVVHDSTKECLCNFEWIFLLLVLLIDEAVAANIHWFPIQSFESARTNCHVTVTRTDCVIERQKVGRAFLAGRAVLWNARCAQSS